MKKLLKLLILPLFALFANCQKEGPEGAPGKDGNANVISTSITTSNWNYVDPSWVAFLNVEAITQNIVNKGSVLVYIKVGDFFSQLPLTFYQSSDYSTSIEVSHSVGVVNVIWTDSDLFQPINPGLQTFKVVVIESSSLISTSDVDFSNYEEVKRAFNLVD